MILSVSNAFERSSIAKHVNEGGLIAYPTEAVVGVGCDPSNADAVTRLLKLKGRSVDQGLIVVTSTFESVNHWCKPVDDAKMESILAQWPGHITWLFQASSHAPKWVVGDHSTIAIRISAHPIVEALCRVCGPLISTSANRSGEPPCVSISDAKKTFGDSIDIYVSGAVGPHARPSTIIDVKTQKVIRE